MPVIERQSATTLDKVKPDHVRRYRWAAERLRGWRVLDCGCGVGYGSKIIADSRPDIHVVAVDNAEEALAIGRRHYASPRVVYVRDDMRTLENTGDYLIFDTIVAFESLEHVERPGEVLKRFQTLLAADGVLLVSLPIVPTVATNKFHKFEVANADEAVRFFEANGFALAEPMIPAKLSALFELVRAP